MRRVVITGRGALCSLGNDVASTWQSMLEGRSGIGELTKVTIPDFPVKVAAQINNFKLDENILAEKDQAHFDDFALYALHAGVEAFNDAQLSEADDLDKDRVGSILGVGIGGFTFLEKNYQQFLDRGYRRVSPFFISGMIPNMAASLLSMHYSLHGPSLGVTSACASSGHAMEYAFLHIRQGLSDIILTGGTESILTSYTGLAGFNVIKALSRGTDSSASRPFDKTRDGFVMGEGAAILVFEELEHAKKRGAKIYAELVGCASTSDAYHVTAPHPDGKYASKCMSLALEMARVKKEEIDYINAHGTSTPAGDIAETVAIKDCFQKHAYQLNVSSTKSVSGHLLGAAGALESLACIQAINNNIIPPTAHLQQADEQCDLNYTPLHAQKREVRYALNNAFGFGGTNASLLFKRYEE